MNDGQKKITEWANSLLATNKRNNLINFKETKTSAVEIISPNVDEIFDMVGSQTKLEIYDNAFDITELDGYLDEDNPKNISLPKDEFIKKISNNVLSTKHIAVTYNSHTIKTKSIITSLSKKANSFLEETGVNILYMSFGMINWYEDEHSDIEYHAPILLTPVAIENESRDKPFYLNISNEDIVLNPIFEHKMKDEYGINLPEYSGGSLEDFINSINEIIQKFKWSIDRNCYVSLFSFQKINMYTDLATNSEFISKTPNIQQILGDSERENYDGEEFKEEAKNINNIEFHTVVDADSSQEEAILASKKGFSFVLQGPPGTGKSQTITNIIAEALYDGKKVLFVSEKLAALNVVYEKLKKANLDDFCLELHSSKANKKRIVDDLNQILAKEKTDVNSNAKYELDELLHSKKILDKYNKELYKIRPELNKSLFEIYQSIAKYRTYKDIDFVIRDIKEKDIESLNQTCDLLKDYVGFIPSIGSNYKDNFWYGLNLYSHSYEDDINLNKYLSTFEECLKFYDKLAKELTKKYGLVINNLQDVINFSNFFKLVSFSKYISSNAITNFSQESYTTLKEISDLAKQILDYKSEIDLKYDRDFYNLDYKKNIIKLENAKRFRIFKTFTRDYKDVLTELKANLKVQEKLTFSDVDNYIRLLKKYCDSVTDFNEKEHKIENIFSSKYNHINSNWDEILLEFSTLNDLGLRKEQYGIFSTLSEEEFESKQSEYSDIKDKFTKLNEKYGQAQKYILGVFDRDKYNLLKQNLSSVIKKIHLCSDKFGTLDNWIQFVNLLEKIQENGDLEYIYYSISNELVENEIIGCYCKTFFKQHARIIVDEDDFLKDFNRIKHDDFVKTFQQKDRISLDINKSLIRANVSHNRPNLFMVSRESSVSVILQEGKKKRRQKSIRRLMNECGEVIQTLKPVFLMSPLSVSTYLSKDMQFDLVIFDEASQIFPQDAIGAIYRGKQLIVVGDSKQMPPSNFFTSMIAGDDELYDEDNEDDVTAYESILDFCATSLPQFSLLWHYRSRTEELIAFSNKNFYNNNLISFPSTKYNEKDYGIDFVEAKGVYDSKSRSNKIEAQCVVNTIFDQLSKHKDRSLGVVAFSVAQQDLIESLLMKDIKEDPQKEALYNMALNMPEKLFIKNLESVQGDERDTIIFSVGYAKDSSGMFYHRFGPLNNAGGERRLNVAVTRAKCNVKLVSSIHYTDIDLSRSKAEGARLLREYLDLAENGIEALKKDLIVSNEDQFDSEFELEVCEFLRSKGLNVDTQVGCSNFKIDLGLKVANTSKYVLAIECDGATYHSSKTARDRDRLRQQILESMGWKFYRIWSTDWYRNKNIEKERLYEACLKALKEEKPVHLNSEETKESFDVISEKQEATFPDYRLVNVDLLAAKYVPFGYQHRNIGKFRVFIEEIVEAESPIQIKFFLKRIANCIYDRQKVTSVVTNDFYMALTWCNNVEARNGFLYYKGKRNFTLRLPTSKVKRKIDEISLEELASGMYTLIKENHSIEKEDLFRTLINILEYKVLSDDIKIRLDSAFSYLKNYIIITDGKISIK